MLQQTDAANDARGSAMTAALSESFYCHGCAYDLRGLTSNRCPECGMVIDRSSAGIIAWEKRAKIGRVRAFVRTAVAATFTPIHFARAATGSVDVRSAKRFRWVACLVFTALFSLIFLFEVWDHGGIDALRLVDEDYRNSVGKFWEPLFVWQSGAMLWPTLPAGLLIATILATGIAHWFYTSRLEPVPANRAMALGYYLWLPFACGLLLLAVLGVFLNQTLRPGPGLPLFLQLISPAVVTAWVFTILNGFRAIRAVMKCGVLRPILMVAGIVTQTILAAALGLIVFPAVVGVFRLGIGSLRQ
jgi:hypothetical protein